MAAREGGQQRRICGARAEKSLNAEGGSAFKDLRRIPSMLRGGLHLRIFRPSRPPANPEMQRGVQHCAEESLNAEGGQHLRICGGRKFLKCGGGVGI